MAFRIVVKGESEPIEHEGNEDFRILDNGVLEVVIEPGKSVYYSPTYWREIRTDETGHANPPKVTIYD
ncbi:hypothetical protein [Aeromicrobium sp.]